MFFVRAQFGFLCIGLCNGPLLKKYGYRTVAVAACFMTFVGLVLTSQANSFLQFILFYGILPCEYDILPQVNVK